MNETQFKYLVENSDVFKSFPAFKQNITVKRKVLNHLHDLYGQAERHGISYLKQNPNNSSTDVKLIESILPKQSQS